MPDDAQGLAVTARNQDTAALLDAAVAAYCGLRRDTGDRLKDALAADGGMVMAQLLRGYFMLLFATRKGMARAAATASTINGANPREERHVAALAAWARGDLAAATAEWDAILALHPRDLVAVKLAQYGRFYLGDAASMLAATTRAITAWDERIPGYGYVLGCHAFALEEGGRYREAEAAGRRAVALGPADIWAAHAVAHVFEMEDRPEGGLAWIAANEARWGEINNFVFHVRWHRCLFLLALDRGAEALALYDREVRAESTDEYLDIANAVSLLWRLEQEGIEVGGRWQELAERARAHLDDRALAFADLHYLMALAAGGDVDGVEIWRAGSGGGDTAGQVMARVGRAIGDAALAHRHRDWRRVIDLLMPVRADIHAIGGSHAQRDLFAEMLIDAAAKAAPETAQALLAERIAERPRNHWARRQLARLEQR